MSGIYCKQGLPTKNIHIFCTLNHTILTNNDALCTLGTYMIIARKLRIYYFGYVTTSDNVNGSTMVTTWNAQQK